MKSIHQNISLTCAPIPKRGSVFLLTLIISLTSLYGDSEKTLSPYMELDEGISSASFPLLSTDVKAEIVDGIVKAEIKQVYENRGSVPMEASYVFPLSTQAAVHGMRMKIGERVVIAQIEEKKQAKKIYETAKEEKKVASLLEQHRPNVFQTKVANILPGNQVEIIIQFSEILQAQDLVYEWVFPTVVGPRYDGANNGGAGGSDEWVGSPYLTPTGIEDIEEKTVFSLSVTVKSTLDFKGFQCPTHNPEIDYLSEKEVSVKMDSAQAGFQANKDLILRYKLAEDEIISGLMTHKGEEENFFLITVQPPERVKPEHIPGREYLFVLDVSGSMHGFPLDTAKELFKKLSETLTPSDTFNMLYFSGGSKLYSPTSLPATKKNIAQALRATHNERGGGGTELTKALKRALALKTDDDVSRSIIVITDGYITAESDTFELIRESRNEANLFCFGIGSSVNRHLIEGIAKVGGGEPFVLTHPKNAGKMAETFKNYISSPVLTDIQVTSKGLTLKEVQPAQVNDLFANRALLLTGKWVGEKEGEVMISGKTGSGKDFQQRFILNPASSHENPVIRDLWARQTVRELVDFHKVAEGAEVKKRITNLGLKYSLLTPFTSFVAVDHTPQSFTGKSKEVKQPRPLPAGVSMKAAPLGGILNNGSIPEPSSISLLLLSILSALTVRKRR